MLAVPPVEGQKRCWVDLDQEDDARPTARSKGTEKANRYHVSMLHEWARVFRQCEDPVENWPLSQLFEWLPVFIMQIKKGDGTWFHLKSYKQILNGIQRHLNIKRQEDYDRRATSGAADGETLAFQSVSLLDKSDPRTSRLRDAVSKAQRRYVGHTHSLLCRLFVSASLCCVSR
jgi:hypothetical protein